MRRWKVKRTGRFWDRPVWWVECPSGFAVCQYFTTWREAMEYADKRARTREVVLPRITESKAMIPGARGLILETGRTWDGKRNTWIKDEVSMVYAASYNLRPLALALLALHYQQEVDQ